MPLSELGKWRGYWKTSVSSVDEDKVYIRGYPLAELMGNLSYGELIYLILKGELPAEKQGRMLEAALLAIVDHYFIGSAAPAARFVVSGNPDPIKGIAAGILSIGPHTGSPRAAGEFLERAFDLMVGQGLNREETARRTVAQYRDARERIPGLGHPIHKRDPRALRLRELMAKYGFVGEKTLLFEAIHAEFERIHHRQIAINTDGMIACALCELGFRPIEMEVIGVLTYLPGIMAQTIEEIDQEGRLRILPDIITEYVGPSPRHLPAERIKV